MKYILFLLSIFTIHLQSELIDSTQVDLFVEEALASFEVPGIAVGIIVDGQVVLAKGYGTRDVEKSLPVTAHTRFPIASNTKAFTALLMSQLVEENKVQWDDRVQEHLPEFGLANQTGGATITIRDLLAHRTGLSRHDTLWKFFNLSSENLLKTLRLLEPSYEPREAYIYNNLMYSVAGLIIEKVIGQSWEEAIFSRILLPLGMTESSTSLEELFESSDYAMPHADHHLIPFRKLSPIHPGGGINSSIHDLLKWVQFQLTHRHQSPLLETHLPQIPFSSASLNGAYQTHAYGFGWQIGLYRQYHPMITHSGLWYGFCSFIVLLPEENSGFIILTNDSVNGVHAQSAMRNHILDLLLHISDTNWIEKYHDDFVKERKGKERNLSLFEQSKLRQLSPAALKPYCRSYTCPGYGTATVTPEEGHLRIQLGDLNVPLYFQKNNCFSADLSLPTGIIKFTFVPTSTEDLFDLYIHFDPLNNAPPLKFTPTNPI